jgi:curved DNA-binding protein CbpA
MTYLNDKRLFKRYKHKADFFIIIEGSYYKASTVDFSLNGLCICIEGSPSVGLQSTLALNIEEMELDIQGMVVWVQKTDSNLLVGLQKMSISGLLKYYPISDILLDIQRSDSTGALKIANTAATKQLFIKNGTMVFASSTQAEDRVEEVLLRQGKITNDQYYQFAAVADRTGRRQGSILVEMGYIKPHDLFLAVKHQCEEIILSLFQWEDGRVSFLEGPLPPEIPALKLSAANLIFHGIKRINRPEYFHAICPPLDTILYYSEEPINLFQDIQLTEKDQYVLSLIDSKLTVKEMLSMSSLGEFPTTKILSALLGTRMIVPIGKGYIPDKTIIKIIKEPPKHVDSAFIAAVEDLYRQLDSMDHYQVLGIGSGASPNEVKKAFYQRAKEFHPDRHFGVSSDALKMKLNTIFGRISEAYGLLYDPAERDKYDKSRLVKAPKVEINNSETARARFQDGRASFRKGLYDDAATLFGQAVYFDSSVAEYHYYLGMAYMKQRKLREAEKEVSEAARIAPRNADYMAELGHIYQELGFKSRARTHFEKAVKLDPSNRKAQEGIKAV